MFMWKTATPSSGDMMKGEERRYLYEGGSYKGTLKRDKGGIFHLYLYHKVSTFKATLDGCSTFDEAKAMAELLYRMQQ